MQTTTTFNTSGRYIIIPIFISAKAEVRRRLHAIVATGAPRTEFSDEVLQFVGFPIEQNEKVQIKEGLQTQKYANAIIPKIEICSQTISDLNVYVSRFDKSWGIDALIGLDFFKKFRVTIDSQKGQLITEAY